MLSAAKNKGARISRQQTSTLSEDGLVKRLNNSLLETQEKSEKQRATLAKITDSIEKMMPSNAMRYGENEVDSGLGYQEEGKIRLNNK